MNYKSWAFKLMQTQSLQGNESKSHLSISHSYVLDDFTIIIDTAYMFS